MRTTMLSEALGRDDQAILVKQWFRRYGILLAVAIITLLSVTLGIYYVHQYHIQKIERASNLYQSLISPNTSAIPWANVDELKNHYSKTPYAAFAVLLKAADAVKQNNFKSALSDYRWVIDHTTLITAKQMARINAAKVELSQSHFDQAKS